MDIICSGFVVERKNREKEFHLDIKYQSLTPLYNFTYTPMPSCNLGSPFFPPTFCQIMCSDWSVLLGLADYSEGERREGGSATAARAAKRDKSSRGTPPLVRWTSLPHSRLLLLPSPSPFFPSSLPRFFSIIHQCADSPQLTAPAAAAAPADPSSPLDLLAYSAFFHAHPSIHPDLPFPSMETQSWPFSAAERESKPPSSCSWAAEKKRNPRGEKRGFFSPFFWVLEESWSSASNSPPSSLFGLQFWLCVGTRKRGPKCLKPITCCRCLGVTLRCVALIYVACGDTALASL